MKIFRQSSIRHVFVLLALTSFLLQAQAAFACSMMDTAGPVQDCCCVQPMDIAGTATCDDSGSCCEFSLELFPHTLDAQWAPLWSHLPFDRSPPTLGMIHPYVEDGHSHLVLAGFDRINPASPGTQTYLATLRLRI